jgi:hypothetical protein
MFQRRLKFCALKGKRKIIETNKIGCGHLKESYLKVK